jgi:hypothetical protein
VPDSLVLANTVELLGGGVLSANPLCPGAMFQLQPGADPGAPQPTTDFVASLLLDGERPFGRRASNRTIKLPIWITAPNRFVLAAAREVLQQAIDQDYFTIVWTRDATAGNPGGTPLPLVFDSFRALPTVPVFNTRTEKQLVGTQIQITIPALPYGRSDTQAQVSFTSPVPTTPSVPPPPVPVTLDTFSTISSPLFTQSNQCVVGPNTCRWDPDSFGDPGGQVTFLSYSAALPSPQNLSNMASLQFWLGLGSRYYSNLEFHGKTHGGSVAFTLTDSSGNTLSFSRSNLFLPVASDPNSPVFTRITIPIPQGSTTFNYQSVASYALTITNRLDRVRRFAWVTAYIDNLTAQPGSVQVVPVTRGAVYTIFGVKGTARAPATLSFQQPPSPGTVVTVTATGTGTYTVPVNTVYLHVEAQGGGGAGAGMTVAGVGAGGWGAEYAAELVFPASGGQVIPYVVGAGDTAGATPAGGKATFFGPVPAGTLQVVANGGASVATNVNIEPPALGMSVNAVEYMGGPGRANPPGSFGGGGGSSGGSSSPGNTPQGSGFVAFTTPGTTVWTCPPGVTSVTATPTGAGGGAGAGSPGANGQGGGGGETRVAIIGVTPGLNYNVVVGTGGTGGVSAGNGTAGGLSSFTGDTRSVSANGGGLGLGNSSSTPNNGGSGGTGGTGNSGGRGGDAYPYTGGGGSSAGPSAPGNAGSSPNGAAAPAGGGAGGNGSGPQSGAGHAGSAPGGGGGGSYVNGFNGGAGANGQVILAYLSSTGAPTNAGGAAVTGGGAGGAGAATAANNGSNGSAPGGGGGGAWSSGAAQTGGSGGNGQLKITPFIPASFKSLIVHRPPLGTPKTFQPMVSVGGGSDAPDGTHQYTMPQPVTGVNADFAGTYTILLVNSTWSGSGSRTVFVTVNQFEFAGGSSYSVSTLPVTFTPSQVTNGILVAGVLTLPVKAVAPDNLGGYYTVSVTDSNTSDRYFDCILLDTMGQSVVINEPGSGYLTYYIDAPDPNVSLGRIMGSQGGRANAISVMDNCQAISGGPLFVEPADGDNMLFVYSADGVAPNVSLAYFPCYYFDRTQ